MIFSRQYIFQPIKKFLKKSSVLVRLFHVYRMMSDARHRSIIHLKNGRVENLFQPYGSTSEDRHPELFELIKIHLSNAKDIQLLSYGCSTGEEVFTLRRYFPLACIKGIDINPYFIKICRQQLGKRSDALISFDRAGSAFNEPEAHYDAIFCLSVFRHGDLAEAYPDRCDHLISFANYEKTMTQISQCLKPGGCLVTLGSNFRFADTQCAKEFEVIFRGTDRIFEDTPIYGSENQYLPGVSYNEYVFKKDSVTGKTV